MCLCLTTGGYSRKQAKEDIPCYKVLLNIRKEDGSIELVSPYMRQCKWKIGETKYDKKKACGTISTFKEVNGGYLHTFKDLDVALFSINLPGYHAFTRIYKAIIPKGTYYYEGYSSFGGNSYASKALKIVDECFKEKTHK